MILDGPDFKSDVPESWICVDCGVNTAPRCLYRLKLP